MKIVVKIFLIITGIALLFQSQAFALDNKTDNASAENLLPIEDNQIKIPLKSVLLLALKNNLNIKFESLKPGISETGITREKGVFDTLLSSQWQKTHSVTQVGSALGSSSSPTVKQEKYNLYFSLRAGCKFLLQLCIKIVFLLLNRRT